MRPGIDPARLEGGHLWALRHGHEEARPARVCVDVAQGQRGVGVQLQVRENCETVTKQSEEGAMKR